MKKSILPVVLILLISITTVFSQQPTEMVPNIAGRTITIDGSANDPAWIATPPVDINLAYSSEQPSLNSATWKAVWDTNGLYVLIQVSDNIWSPSWVSGLNSWESDKVELYIDVTDPQKDGGGASGGNGNYQVAPDFPNNNQGILTDFDGNGTVYAGTFDGAGDYIMEYYIPFNAIPTNNGHVIDPLVTNTIGFDPTIIDLDEVSAGRNRAVWANAGGIDESWNNMDDVGLITFVNASDDLISIFSADKTTTGPGKQIQFTDFSNGTPTSWVWDFGDGNSSTDQNPLHTYTEFGDYTISLKITDADDSVSTSTRNNYIQITADALEPTSQFSVSSQNPSTDERIQFTDETLYEPYSWIWYFGDGGISTEQHPSYYYTAPGTYTVALVTSNENGSNTTRKTGYITVSTGQAPIAEFVVNETSVFMNEPLRFTDNSTNHPTRWEWDFGDGNESTLQNPEHTYTRAGVYDVRLEVENSSGTGFLEKKEFVVIVATPLSAQGLLAKNVQVYPNPSDGLFTVNVTDISSEEVQLKVFNITGKTIFAADKLQDTEFQLDLRQQAKGIYFLQLKTKNIVRIEKLIIE